MCQAKSLRAQNMQYHNVPTHEEKYFKTNSVSFTKYNNCLGSINKMYENTFSDLEKVKKLQECV